MVGFLASRIWKKAPFVRLLLPAISGLLVQEYFSIPNWVCITVILTSLVLIVSSLLFSAMIVFQFPAFSGFIIHLLLIAAGCQVRSVNEDRPVIIRSQAGVMHTFIIEPENIPVRKGKGMRCVVAVGWEIKNGRCYIEREQLLLYFRDSVVPAGWEPGSVRMISVRLMPIRNKVAKPSGKPERTFDYAGWCARKHIHSSAFSDTRASFLLVPPHRFLLRTTLMQLQDRLRRLCQRYVPSRQQGGLLEALLIGYTGDLDPDVLRSYSDAGVVHIIAISGLHLALIGELLQTVLQLIGSGRRARVLRLVLLLSVVWGYSLLTGASPSVLRSAVMFSFVLLARHFALQAPVYNALAGSAFLLLCDDPFRLWDTGFQLSYAAVLSLILFVQPVRRWLHPKNKLLISLWNAASVTIAAQILTTPVSIWYFHRFPVYFLLSNLFAVPLSSAILLGGIGLMFMAWCSPFAVLLGRLLDMALQLMNGFVALTNRLPGSAATGIAIHLFQVGLCYSMLYAVCRFSHKGNRTWLFIFLIQVCVFLADGLNS